MLRTRQMQGRRLPKGLQAPKVVTITSTLTADWPLNFKTQEELLAFVSDLENQVTEADLAGMKDQKALSPEAEELDEEMQMMMAEMSSYGEEEIKPGEPRFLYVATLTEAGATRPWPRLLQWPAPVRPNWLRPPVSNWGIWRLSEAT